MFVLKEDLDGDMAEGRRNAGEDLDIDLEFELDCWKIADSGGGRRDEGVGTDLVDRCRGGGTGADVTSGL